MSENTELKTIIEEFVSMETDNKIFSKIRGNRNWGIKTEHYFTPNGQEIKVAYVGKFGTLNRRGMLSAKISDIAKYHIRWYEYTYKKDLEHTIMILAENDYYIKWI